MKRSIVPILITLVYVILPGIVYACPNCKEAYIEGGGSVSAGFSASILFMMITPFVVMGLIGFRILHSMRKKRREEEQALTPDA